MLHKEFRAMPSVLNAKHFQNEKAAYAFVENIVWPEGPTCPHCGECERIGELKGKSTRIGVRKCYSCRKPFTVKVGTIFESSHIELHIWLQAMFLLSSSKKGISSNQLARALGVTLKSAWFLSHRIREAMRDDAPGPFGSGGGIVEADETFIGRDPKRKVGAGYEHKFKVFALVDRTTGKSKSVVVDSVTMAELTPIIREHVSKEARIVTDEAGQYRRLHEEFAAHGVVNHGKDEYVSKADPTINTQSIEGYFSVFKRGMKGVYQHCDKQHLHRYLAEFDFRYSNRVRLGVDDAARTVKAIKGAKGKRLTYQTTRRQGASA